MRDEFEVQDRNEDNIEVVTKETKPRNNGSLFPIISTLSLIGVVVILIIMLFGGNKTSPAKQVDSETFTGELRIAYVNTDSIMLEYEYAKDLEAGLKTYQNQLESSYESQLRRLQTDFENYMKTGDRLTLTEQKKTEEDLARREREIPQLQQESMVRLQTRQMEDNEKLLNAVYAFIRDYNAKNDNYNIILSKSYVSSAILYADTVMDITKEIIEGLNKEYKQVKKK